MKKKSKNLSNFQKNSVDVLKKCQNFENFEKLVENFRHSTQQNYDLWLLLLLSFNMY